MRNPSYVIIFCVALMSCTKSPGSNNTDSLLQHFCDYPTGANWDKLVASGKENVDIQSKIIIALDDFNTARVKRDFPNSMASAQSPSDNVRAIEDALRNRYDVLRKLDHDRLLIILDKWSQQRNTDEWVWTAAEIYYRLYPRKFEERCAELAKSQPDNAAVFREVRQRFLAGHGHIGSW